MPCYGFLLDMVENIFLDFFGKSPSIKIPAQGRSQPIAEGRADAMQEAHSL